MSRTGNIEPIQVKPSNNVFTALAAGALVASIVALIVLFVRSSELFQNGLLGG